MIERRWCDGQVYPDVGQEFWRPGPDGPGVYLCEMRGEPCPGSRELEKRALDGENLKGALKKETWLEIGVERKERR
ncbi:hypothetical protein TNCV_1772551 [Trichonephila clavipes]|nr:hypothetical protein TNCV_1772551 [Trichonephila clavipes]